MSLSFTTLSLEPIHLKVCENLHREHTKDVFFLKKKKKEMNKKSFKDAIYDFLTHELQFKKQDLSVA